VFYVGTKYIIIHFNFSPKTFKEIISTRGGNEKCIHKFVVEPEGNVLVSRQS
jgi:hypothetical protein